MDDKSIKIGGGQHTTTLYNYNLPTSISNALPYVSLRPCTDKEWDELPHVILTSDMDWDPIVLGFEVEVDNEEWFDAQSSFPD